MAGEAEIERMVVRLLGDASQYEKVLGQGVEATKSFARKVNKQFEAVVAGATKMAKSVGKAIVLRMISPILAFGVAATSVFSLVSKPLLALASGMKNVGRSMLLGVTVPLVAIGIAAILTGSRLETAFVEVRKNVNATESELAELRVGFTEMAREVPLATTELLKIGATGGQLGIATEGILTFTETIAAMGVATNLTTEEAAKGFATIANLTGLPEAQFENLGSSIVALGANSNATESAIVNLAARIASVGTNVGLSESQIVGFAAAITSVGESVEAGGTSFSRLLSEIQVAAAVGGDELQSFARIAGATATEFADKFRVDAAGAVVDFLQGLKNLDKEARTLALVDLGLDDVRLKRLLLSASAGVDTFTDALTLSDKAFQENTALAREAALAYGTVASQFQILKNVTTELLGKVFVIMEPTLVAIIDAAKRLVTWFSALSPAILKLIVIGGTFLALLGPVLIALGSVLATVVGLVGSILATATALALVGVGFAFLGVVMPFLLATASALFPLILAGLTAALPFIASAALGFTLLAAAVAAIPVVIAGVVFGLVKIQQQTQAFTPLIEAVQAMASRIKAQLLPTLGRLATAVRDLVVPVFENMFEILGTGIKMVTPVFLFFLGALELKITALNNVLETAAFTLDKLRRLNSVAATAVLEGPGAAAGVLLGGGSMQPLTGAKGGDGASATDGGSGVIETTKRAIADAGKAFADITDPQKAATKSLEEWTRSQLINIATLGMTSRESRIYQAQLDGVSEATLNTARATSEALTNTEEMIEGFRRARREIEQVDDTISSLVDEVFGLKNGLAALDRLRLERLGASPEQLGEFDRLTTEQGQLKASQKAQRDAESQAKRNAGSLTMRNAAQVGTAEAASRISAFRAGAGPSSDTEETANNTGRIVEILEEMLNSDPLTVSDLGFGGGGLTG